MSATAGTPQRSPDGVGARTLADALPAEVLRVSAKRDRWRDMAHDDPDLGRSLGLGILVMEATIAEGVAACASGDVLRMIRAFVALQGYDDDA